MAPINLPMTSFVEELPDSDAENIMEIKEVIANDGPDNRIEYLDVDEDVKDSKDGEDDEDDENGECNPERHPGSKTTAVPIQKILKSVGTSTHRPKNSVSFNETTEVRIFEVEDEEMTLEIPAEMEDIEMVDILDLEREMDAMELDDN